MSDSNKKILSVMLGFCLLYLAFFFIQGDMASSISGLKTICTSPAQSCPDYFSVGGPGACFLNAFLMGMVTVGVLVLSKAALNGVSMMCFFLVTGFAFFGLNIYSMLPLVAGSLLFAAVNKEPLSGVVNVGLFATGMGPFVSEVSWRYPAGGAEGNLALGIFTGLFIGFMLPCIFRHTPAVHKKFSAYNGAAADGFLSIFMYAVLYRALGVEVPSFAPGYIPMPQLALSFTAVTAGLCIAAGFVLNGKSFKGYGELLTKTGFGTDYIGTYGAGLALINMGLVMLTAYAYYTVGGAAFNGATFGCLICFMATAGACSHPLNILPIMLGYAAASSFCSFSMSTQGMVIGVCFAAGLVPFVGSFGAVAGVISGICHSMMASTVGLTHGGFLLYNGGFTCTLVCLVLVPLCEYYFKPAEKMGLLPVKKDKQ